jgi:hypothetical protein
VLVAEHDGPEHDLLGELLRLRLDHQNRVGGAGDHEIEDRLLHLLERRVEAVLAADIADARAPIGPMKGTPESVSAAEAATMPTMSGSFSRSCESTVTTTWVSFL